MHKIELIFLAQTDKTDDKRYDLEVKTQKTAKEIVELETRIKGIKGKFFYHAGPNHPAGPDVTDIVPGPEIIKPGTLVKLENIWTHTEPELDNTLP